MRKGINLMTEEKLKPCPFCGSDNIAVRFGSVCCRECDANINSYDEKNSIKSWNTRATDNQDGKEL